MELKIREKSGVVILELRGELRLMDSPSPSLQKTILEEIAADNKDILLNFEHVDFIDSYGIGDLLAGYIAIREKGGKLKIAGLSDKLWLILNYTGLTKILEIFDSEEKALKSFV